MNEPLCVFVCVQARSCSFMVIYLNAYDLIFVLVFTFACGLVLYSFNNLKMWPCMFSSIVLFFCGQKRTLHACLSPIAASRSKLVDLLRNWLTLLPRSCMANLLRSEVA